MLVEDDENNNHTLPVGAKVQRACQASTAFEEAGFHVFYKGNHDEHACGRLGGSHQDRLRD